MKPSNARPEKASDGRPAKASVALPSGACIEYLKAGQGQPLVYLHGASGVPAGASFLPQLAATFRVLAPARPGYDGSTASCRSARDEAEVMAAFIRQVAGGRVHLVAESAGGACGCWLAILYPELVATLVLAAPTAFSSIVEPDAADRDELVFGAHPAWTEWPSEQERAQWLRNLAAHAALAHPADGNQELLQRLPEISAPTLILWGTADRLVPPEAGQVYSQRIPTSYRVYVYGAAHSVPISACAKFVRLTTDFAQRGEAFVVNAP